MIFGDFRTFPDISGRFGAFTDDSRACPSVFGAFRSCQSSEKSENKCRKTNSGDEKLNVGNHLKRISIQERGQTELISMGKRRVKVFVFLNFVFSAFHRPPEVVPGSTNVCE